MNLVEVFQRMSSAPAVISFLTWDWALALRQAGAPTVRCCPIERSSLRLLCKVRNTVPGLTAARELGESLSLVVGHLHSIDQLQAVRLIDLESADRVVLSCPLHLRRPVERFLFQDSVTPGVRWGSQRFSHADLGGLTDLAMTIFWCAPGDSSNEMTARSFQPSHEPIRRRPEGFLEPSARLTVWRKADNLSPALDGKGKPIGLCLSRGEVAWDPTLGYLPSPICQWGWVVTPSIRLGNLSVARPLSPKEKGQVLDWREDWQLAADETWTACKDLGCDPLPARIPAEFLLIALQWWSPAPPSEVTRGTGIKGWERPRVLPPWMTSFKDIQSTLVGAGFGTLVEPSDGLSMTVATKSDAAEVDTTLWDIGGSSVKAKRARGVLQRFLHRIWHLRLEREAFAWLSSDNPLNRTEYDRAENREAVFDCLRRSRRSTWFEWNDGSRLFFWRWPPDLLKEARDGTPVLHCRWPTRKFKARVPSDVEPWMSKLVNEKLRKFLQRRYVIPCPKRDIRVPIVYFPVKKGEDDIRMVWSETEQGVTETIFAPRIFYPALGTLLRRLPNDSWIGDFDIGEQFHNFCLEKKERPCHGLFLPKELHDEFHAEAGVWGRLPMGNRSSPRAAARMTQRAIEIAKGDPKDKKNPFQFEVVLLNLPCDPDCDPSLGTRVIKLDSEGKVAADILICADDGRGFGRSENHATEVIRKCCMVLEFLGVQDAKRKRRHVSQRPGAWSGGAVFSDQGTVRSFLPQARWDKAKHYIVKLADELKISGRFETKHFLSGRGFMVCVSMTCDFVVPFLKGFHLTADAWRPDRDAQGWKFTNRNMSREGQQRRSAQAAAEFEELLAEALNGADDEDDTIFPIERELDDWDEIGNDHAKVLPACLTPVPRMEFDLRALSKIFESDVPLVVPRALGKVVSLTHGFGDASGEGHGSRIGPAPASEADPTRTRLRRGFWCTRMSECSSNHREFRNLLEAVRDCHEAADLTGAELWIFTDNIVTENVFYSGTSSDPELFNLMLEFKLLSCQCGFLIHMVHVAGTRMIAEGTDGLSRGELHIGPLADPDAQVVPLHLSAFDRSPTLWNWVTRWLGDSASQAKLATPCDWCHGAHFPTHVWVWAPPPAAALYALEELGAARVKRFDEITAVVILPLLMRPEWFRRFNRTVDCFFAVSPNHPFWTPDMHEPLLIGFCFPLLRGPPWVWRKAEFMVELGRSLSSLHKKDANAGRDLLRKFWHARSWAAGMPPELVSRLLSRPSVHPLLGLSSSR